MVEITMAPCKCGGKAKYVCEWGMDDQFVCTKCDYKTKSYFDGDLYAADEWNRRNTDRPSALQEAVRRRMASIFGRYGSS